MSIPPFNRLPNSGQSKSSDEDEPSNISGKTDKQFALPTNPKKQPPNQNKQQSSTKKGNTVQKFPFNIPLAKEKEKEEKDSKKEDNQKLDVNVPFDQPKIFFGQTIYGQAVGVQSVDLSKVTDVIQKMVDQMMTGGIEGTQIASVELKSSDVPPMFAGSTVTLVNNADGLIIKFENFQTPQDQAAAVKAMENNPQALEQLIRNLALRDVAVTQIQVGENHIPIPRTETPIIFQAPQSAESQPDKERGQGDQDQGQQKRDQEETEE